MFKESLKLVDGARESDYGTPVLYFSRTKLRKGRYILFYRAAFSSSESKNEFTRGGKPVKDKIYVHESHKIVVGCQVPEDAPITMTRISTKYYNKELFLQMK
jgi:hypothetical protein